MPERTRNEPIKIKYEQVDEAIYWHNKVKDKVITFKAVGVRQERTGVHARISIICDQSVLGWSFFNVERSEDRGRLSNQCYSRLSLDSYGKEELRYDLDAFCDGLWDFILSRFVPEMMIGEETTGPPNFMLSPYILEGGGSIIFSPPGRGKSNTALVWAVSIDAGIDKLWKVQQGPVLYINLERSAQSLRKRLANTNIVLGLPAKRPLLAFNERGKSLSNLVPAVRQAIKQHGVKLLVLDSISRTGYGDLNEGTTANNIIDTLNNLCPTWLALGHTSRASEEHLYGSIMADAGADIIIQLRSQVSDGKLEHKVLGIGYEITKANDISPQGQKIYAFEFDDWKLVNIRPAVSQEFPEIEGKNRVDMLTSVTDFILEQESGDATATQIANELGFNRANISSLLSKRSDKFIRTRKEKSSQYYGVVDNTQTH